MPQCNRLRILLFNYGIPYIVFFKYGTKEQGGSRLTPAPPIVSQKVSNGFYIKQYTLKFYLCKNVVIIYQLHFDKVNIRFIANHNHSQSRQRSIELHSLSLIYTYSFTSFMDFIFFDKQKKCTI